MSTDSLAPDPVLQNGAYGVAFLAEQDRVLIVQAANGRLYLPGGRLEPFENAGEALLREVEEECGCTAVLHEEVHRQDHPIFAGRVRLSARYWRVTLGERVTDWAEHRPFWVAPEDACRKLHRPGDIAAVRKVCRLI